MPKPIRALTGLACAALFGTSAIAADKPVQRIDVASYPIAEERSKSGETPAKPFQALPRIPGPVIETRLVRAEDGSLRQVCATRHDHAGHRQASSAGSGEGSR